MGTNVSWRVFLHFIKCCGGVLNIMGLFQLYRRFSAAYLATYLSVRGSPSNLRVKRYLGHLYLNIKKNLPQIHTRTNNNCHSTFKGKEQPPNCLLPKYLA